MESYAFLLNKKTQHHVCAYINLEFKWNSNKDFHISKSKFDNANAYTKG